MSIPNDFIVVESNADFIIGTDNFNDLQIHGTPINSFYYFFNKVQRKLIKQFILDKREKVNYVCRVLLIKKGSKFTPRLAFSVRNNQGSILGKKKQMDEDILIRANVNLIDCHENFWKLIAFLKSLKEEVDIPDENFSLISQKDFEITENLKTFFKNPDKQKMMDLIISNNILPNDLIISLQIRKKTEAIHNYESMLKQNLVEQKWQSWFQENSWVLGSEFVEILDERVIDTAHITDYLMKAYDGFLDIIEIKRPEGDFKFWADEMDHSNYVPSNSLMKAITQAVKYIYEIEREANSIKFLERVKNTKTIKPRCILIFGRSDNWNQEQREAYRILNASYHNLTILTYDHVLDRAKKIIGIDISRSQD